MRDRSNSVLRIEERNVIIVFVDGGGVPEWLMGADCKSASLAFGGSNPPPSTKPIYPAIVFGLLNQEFHADRHSIIIVCNLCPFTLGKKKDRPLSHYASKSMIKRVGLCRVGGECSLFYGRILQYRFTASINTFGLAGFLPPYERGYTVASIPRFQQDKTGLLQQGRNFAVFNLHHSVI